MILSNKHDIEQGTSYSFILAKRDNISLADLEEIANSLLAPFGYLPDNTSLPLDLSMLRDVSVNLNDRRQSIAKIANKLYNKNHLNCEEISIVDYGCGQGLASLCFLDWLFENNLIDNIKQVKLVDKDKVALSRALLHFATIFPNIDVVAINQDFLSNDFAVECNSVLTINLFSHVLGCEFKLIGQIKKLILRGHNLLMHNIILDEISSKSYPEKLKSYYWNYTKNKVIDFTGCEILFEEQFTTQKRFTHTDKIKLFKYAVLSRTNFSLLSIPKVENNFTQLCPGEPNKKLYNVPQRMLWFERPLENTEYCEALDNYNKISFDEKFVSPLFVDTWKKEADEMNPKTIKACAEKFHQGHICHALDCDLPCGHEIVALYERAAADGITEAYNNLAILQFQKRLDDETAEQKAIELCKLAAEGGSDCAMINLASSYMDNDDIESAMKYYKLAADKGNGVALLNLAIISHFGLYGNIVDLAEAEKLYRQCITEFNKDEEHDWRNDSIINICCLNLMLLLEEKDEHYLKILDVYYSVKKPFDTLKYCKEVLQIIYTNRFSKDILDILELDDPDEKEKPYKKFNRAIFLYYGLNLKSFDVKFDQDKDKALDIMKQLAEDDTINWEDKPAFVYGLYANWAHSNKEKLGEVYELYWRVSAQANSNRACAYLTNIANFCSITDEEKKSIWKRFAFANGCTHCHECENYSSKKICPKAQFNWASKYETQKDVSTSLIQQSAAQQYAKALLYLGFGQAIKEHMPSFKEDTVFNIVSRFFTTEPPKEYRVLFPILAKDDYYTYLQSAADVDEHYSRSIIPFVAEKRADTYNFVFWASVFCSKSNNEDLKLKIVKFLKTKCSKSIDAYFMPSTICEIQMLEMCEAIGKNTKDTSFICKLANFFLQGKNLYKAQSYFNLAKEKGCNDVDDILNTINTEIKRIEEENSRHYYDDYDPYENYSWEDSMMDALDGEPDAYWNID